MKDELLARIREKRAEYQKITDGERDTVKIFRAQGSIEALDLISDMIEEIEQEEQGE